MKPDPVKEVQKAFDDYANRRLSLAGWHKALRLHAADLLQLARDGERMQEALRAIRPHVQYFDDTRPSAKVYAISLIVEAALEGEAHES